MPMMAVVMMIIMIVIVMMTVLVVTMGLHGVAPMSVEQGPHSRDALADIFLVVVRET
jgi:hypothetical protein